MTEEKNIMAKLEAGDQVKMTGAPNWTGEITEILEDHDQVLFRNDADGNVYQFRAEHFTKQ